MHLISKEDKKHRQKVKLQKFLRVDFQAPKKPEKNTFDGKHLTYYTTYE
jgi:hypothetical protein